MEFIGQKKNKTAKNALLYVFCVVCMGMGVCVCVCAGNVCMFGTNVLSDDAVWLARVKNGPNAQHTNERNVATHTKGSL